MTARSIDGTPVTTRLAMKMEDSLQAFAVRAACFIGELDVPFSEEFDGHDYGATHVIACLGDEPIRRGPHALVPVVRHDRAASGDAALSWPQCRAVLLERCRTLAASRGCTMLYAQVLPYDTGYWEKQGWRRLVPETTAKAAPRQIVSMVKAVDPSKPLPEVEAPEAIVLQREPLLDSSCMPSGTITN